MPATHDLYDDFETYEGVGPTFMSRVVGNDGDPITQATLDSILYEIYDVSRNTVIDEGILIVSTVVFDTYQTGDSRWDDNGGDSTGYNFLWSSQASQFPRAGRIVVTLKFRPIAPADPVEDQFIVQWRGTVVSVREG